jgi:hypothetical protein
MGERKLVERDTVGEVVHVGPVLGLTALLALFSVRWRASISSTSLLVASSTPRSVAWWTRSNSSRVVRFRTMQSASTVKVPGQCIKVQLGG